MQHPKTTQLNNRTIFITHHTNASTNLHTVIEKQYCGEDDPRIVVSTSHSAVNAVNIYEGSFIKQDSWQWRTWLWSYQSWRLPRICRKESEIIMFGDIKQLPPWGGIGRLAKTSIMGRGWSKSRLQIISPIMIVMRPLNCSHLLIRFLSLLTYNLLT